MAPLYGFPDDLWQQMLSRIGPGLPTIQQQLPQRRTLGMPPRNAPAPINVPPSRGPMRGPIQDATAPNVPLPGSPQVDSVVAGMKDLYGINPAMANAVARRQLAPNTGTKQTGAGPIGANAFDTANPQTTAAFNAANQRLSGMEQKGPPQYHGFKKFFDTLARLTPYGNLVEGAAGIGTTGYRDRLAHAKEDVDRLGQQLNHDSVRRYQTRQPTQDSQATPAGWSLQPNDDAQRDEDTDHQDNEDEQNLPYQGPTDGMGLGTYDSPQNSIISALNPVQASLKKKAQAPRELWTFYS
ncbi:MAG TPA: hypothetical protein VK738_04285 [Terriglobales bacterium]|jgi:hypothetical protein|nr:hypothetical protein [Terriglobales bacterium]